MKTRVLLGLTACAIMLAGPTTAQEKTLTITVRADKHDYKNVPISVPLELPGDLKDPTVVQLKGGGFSGPWQETQPALLTESIKADGKVRRDLHVVLPDLKAGTTLTWTAKVMSLAPDPLRGHPGALPKPQTWPQALCVDWKEEGKLTTLFGICGSSPKTLQGGRVAQYMHEAYDNSSKENRDRTYKVFHHLFDPTGQRLVTNGGYTDENITDPKKLLYPHHRGLMYAFNRISYEGGPKADTWHAQPGDTHQEHVKCLSASVGPVLARHRVLIDWHGPKNDVFAEEDRELTFYSVPAGILVEFASRLKTTGGPVKLDGDPQHAGFQFRAANAVAEKTAKQTYFLRPDGKGGLGETRNWDPKTRKGPVNLPWDAMSFVLDGKRYTVAYLNHPDNPGEQRYSERDYGRFGCYFEGEVTKDRPLVVRYRVWLQEGEMTVPHVEALSTAFVDPPRVTVK
jgi:hypothetical protein